MRLSPRTPDGPSDTLSAGMPRRSTGGRYHMLAPAVRDAFSSRVMAPMRRSISLSNRPLSFVVSSYSQPSSSPRVDEGAPTAGPRPFLSPPPRAAAPSAWTKRRRVTAGSITSSISKCSATWTAFPCS